MADLENLLLEAAGRTNSAKKPLRNSDDGASMEASCHIPFKKRYEQTEVGEDEEDDDDSSDVGSDLYKDDDDREMLAAMTELEREIILSDRASKRDDKKLREQMKQKLNEKRPANPPPRRSSAKKTSRENVLTQLRNKKRGSKSGWEKPALTSSSDDDDDDDDDEVEDEARVDESESNPDPPFFDDVKAITIRRSKLGKWFTEPFFEELIVGCFVRIGIGMSESGPVYRLCQVSSVEASSLESEYTFDGNKRTHKRLVCFWGSERSAAKWKMAMVSDSEPTEEEFEQWGREVVRSGGKALKRREVLEKIESIENAANFVYSAKAVKQILEEKKRSRGPVSVAVEKEQLRRKLEAAESRSDEAEAGQIRARLSELEEARRRAEEERDAKAVKLSEMNKRNRAENLKNASSERSRGLRAGEAGYDPFSRRWTRSRNCYQGKLNFERDGDEAVAEKDKGTKSEADTGDGRKSAKSGEEMWNFEIVISLDKIEGFGPQGVKLGYMARKQRIEAMIGRRVVEIARKRGSQILTVSDYRKRRGML